jgi:hypothetical protein
MGNAPHSLEFKAQYIELDLINASFQAITNEDSCSRIHIASQPQIWSRKRPTHIIPNKY